MRRLLLVDRTPEFFDPLLPKLAARYDLRLCCDGGELLAELLAFRPELLVLDLSVPHCDAAGVLRVARTMDICPQVLAVSHSTATPLPEDLISFLMVKPFDPEELIKRISNMEQLLVKNRQDRLYALAGSIMAELGLQQNLIGCACLQEAAVYLCEHENCLFTDELYPHVAKQVQGSVSSVEKAMSRSVESAWKKRNEPVWRYYFENAHRCPTNARFLKALVKAINKAY